jgi:hypothetical protein
VNALEICSTSRYVWKNPYYTKGEIFLGMKEERDVGVRVSINRFNVKFNNLINMFKF